RGGTRTVVQRRQGPVFGGGQYRDLSCRTARKSVVSAGAGAGRRRSRDGAKPGLDLEPAGRFRVVYRNQSAAVPDQYQLKSRYFQADLSGSQRWPLNSFANASTEPLSSFWSPSSSPLDSSARLRFGPADSSFVETTGLL